jgi:hypothetical protein
MKCVDTQRTSFHTIEFDMNEVIERVIKYFGQYPAELLPLLCSFPPFLLSFYRLRYFNTEYKYLFIYVWLTFLFEVVNSAMAFQGISNLYLYNFYGIAEGLLLLKVYFDFLTQSPQYRKLLIVFGIFFSVYGLWDILYSEAFTKKFNSYTYMGSAFLLIISSLLFFLQMLQNTETTSLRGQPKFWFNAGSLLYFSGTFFVFMFSELIISANQDIDFFSYWSIYSIMVGVFRIFMYICLQMLKGNA